LTFKFEGENVILVDYQDYHQERDHAHAQPATSR
jgi:hypothetical protein